MVIKCDIIAGKPSAPLNLRVVEVSRDFAVLSWDVPETDGGAPITSYTIEKRDMSKDTFITVSSTDQLTFKVKRLFEGGQYLFRVAAENKIGIGEYTQLANPVTAKLPFGKCVS